MPTSASSGRRSNRRGATAFSPAAPCASIAIAGTSRAARPHRNAASRVAGHLSRQMSRPLDEMVRWTELHRARRAAAAGAGADGGSTRDGTARWDHDRRDDEQSARAPEFETLRRSMREWCRSWRTGAQAIEAERLKAYRESARRVAHEIKNPLTPIRFALDAAAWRTLRETLQEDCRCPRDRIGATGANGAKLSPSSGGCPKVPSAEIDVGELVRYTARSCVPPERCTRRPDRRGSSARASATTMRWPAHLVTLYSTLSTRATEGGRITVEARVRSGWPAGRDASDQVADTGKGIAPENLEQIWDPYVTTSPAAPGSGSRLRGRRCWRMMEL